MSSILLLIPGILIGALAIAFMRHRDADKKRDRAYDTQNKLYGYDWIKKTDRYDVDVIKSHILVSFLFRGRRYVVKQEDFDSGDMVKTIEGVYVNKTEIDETTIERYRISQGVLKGDFHKSRLTVLMRVDMEDSTEGLIVTYPVIVTDGYNNDRLTYMSFVNEIPYSKWLFSESLSYYGQDKVDKLFEDWDSLEKLEREKGE